MEDVPKLPVNVEVTTPNESVEINEIEQPDPIKENVLSESTDDPSSSPDKNSVDGDKPQTNTNDYEAVFGEFQSSEDESSEDGVEEDPESDYEQQAKKNLQKIAAKKKRSVKKDKSDEPPKKKRKTDKDKQKNDRIAKKLLADAKKLEEKTKLVQDILNKMRDVYDADLVEMEMRRPALKKLSMLPEIERRVPSVGLQKLFVDLHVLDELGKWLRPLPDKSLPNLQIRKVLLKTLYSLNTNHITLQLLQDSGVGKFVHLYSIHPKETRENKELASRILSKWLELDRLKSA
mmetsp:Transcript_130510/g.194328  ORF Transcript_130510/g.194328 Transcript_130510/m.194328 type:complete len:290 (-) Transcript_130510:25-894(-)